MPVDVVLAGGGSVKVTANLTELTAVLSSETPVFATSRFAGFRGDDVVAGEAVTLRLAAVGYVVDIPAP